MTEPVTPIASSDDLALFLGLASAEDGRACALIGWAQSLAESVVYPLPVSAMGIVLSVAGRAYTNPQNAVSQGAGPFTTSFGATASGGLYLTAQERAALKRMAGRGGAFTIDPTAANAGTGLPPWDLNVTWLDGVPLAEDRDNYR